MDHRILRSGSEGLKSNIVTTGEWGLDEWSKVGGEKICAKPLHAGMDNPLHFSNGNLRFGIEMDACVMRRENLRNCGMETFGFLASRSRMRGGRISAF